MDYKNKYLKYKTKYIQLKRNNQSGGGDIIKSKCITNKYDSLCVNASKLPLKAHQKTLVKHIMTHRGLLAIHSVGSGKTLSAVTLSFWSFICLSNSRSGVKLYRVNIL